MVGQVQNGGTQVDFTPDNNYFIAPSVTYKPDVDTTFTVLASASKTDTRGINFLPYTGTVIDAPFGRIPTKLFVGDPSVDSFKREQEMIGYQFERNVSDSVTFRQNARYAHVDLTYRGFIGNDYTTLGNRRHRALQLVRQKTPPTRAIWTTSWNIVSIPARAAHDAVRPRSEKLSDRRLSDFRLWHRALD